MAILEGDEERAKTSTGTDIISTAIQHDEEIKGSAHENGEICKYRASLSNSENIGGCITDHAPGLEKRYFPSQNMRRWSVLALGPYFEEWGVNDSSHASAG